jgi:hypothetical protein
MKTFPPIMLVALLSLPSLCSAADPSSPADYFNTGAERFINSDLETAKARVNEGLSNFPNDAKLAALKQLLEQQQQQQQQQNQDSQQDKDQQKEQQEKQDQQQQKDQQQQEQDKQEQQKQDASSGQDQQAQKPQDAPARPEELTPEDAKLLLDAAKENEQSAREQIRMIMGRPVPVEKDW